MDDQEKLEFYEYETKAAERLMNSSPEVRGNLYKEIYSELFERWPELRDNPHIDDIVMLQLELLKPFLNKDTKFLEIGSGSLHLSKELVKYVGEVVTVEPIPPELEEGEEYNNLTILEASMPPYELEPQSIDLVFSSHFIEHLHPEDAQEHAKEMRRLLKEGGHYICITPNRIYGPYDSSSYFDDEVAKGLHLKEYTYSEVYKLLKNAGFTKVSKVFIGEPPNCYSIYLCRIIEFMFLILPFKARRNMLNKLSLLLSTKAPLRTLEQVVCIATR